MNKLLSYTFWLSLLLCVSMQAEGQATYYMSTDTVDDCEGILFDSDAGAGGHYDHGEDFTFIICVPGASSIDISWVSFCTEADYDTVFVYDGLGTGAPLHGFYTGPTLPTGFTSSGPYVTIRFVSDASVSCDGWEMHWTVNPTPPPPISILPIPDIDCGSDSIILTLDGLVDCDSVSGWTYTLLGPGAVPSIVSATPAPCMGDSTTSIRLDLSGPMLAGCDYTIYWYYGIVDPCDEYWPMGDTATFSIRDCPIELDILGDTLVCEGDCVWLYADATGGDCISYTYTWSTGWPSTPGWHMICPADDTVVCVTVDDTGPAPAVKDSIRITVVDNPIADPDTTVCENDAPFFMRGSPSPGTWSGPGILDPLTGLFDPGTAGAGIHYVYYTVAGCYDSARIEVLRIDAGPDTAACISASAFPLSGASPGGGVYSGGPYVTPGGIFDPAISGPGTFVVYYDALGCQDSLLVTVEDIILQANDTICDSDPLYTLVFSPSGGTWSGPGIVDSRLGIFDPALAGGGLHWYVYSIHGCADSLQILIYAVNAGSNLVACPDQDTITLTGFSPPGGTWSGPGIVDTNGRYDPGWSSTNRNDILVYTTPEGCTDTIIVYVRQTDIGVDTLWFCPNDTFVYLDWWTVRRNPWNGVWTGTGITTPSFPGTFDPRVAGVGSHTLYYTANGCYDSMVMVIMAPPVAQADTTVCETSPPFNLRSTPAGVWYGFGITNAFSGTFSPGVTGVGTFKVYVASDSGCIDSLFVTVDPLPAVSLTGLAGGYCVKDTFIQMIGTPPGGRYYGAGVTDSSFNPLHAGSGTHWLYYALGSGDCEVIDSVRVVITDTLSALAFADDDSICPGESTDIWVEARGGASTYSYQWTHGLSNDSLHNVSPAVTTTYTVIVDDGCSDPDTANITIFVFPDILPTVAVNDSVCYGDSGWAEITMPPGDYSFDWSNGDTTPRIDDIAGSYDVTITDNFSGCSIDLTVEMGRYDYINANFNTNPTSCVDAQDPSFDFLDLSVGGTTGYWDFGDGSPTEPYVPGVNPTHTYPRTAGEYVVTLYIENDGACPSVYQLTVCVNGESALWIGNGFTPNGDGLNDVFLPVGFGIGRYKMMVFNRWGEKVFETEDIDQGWDGTYLDQDAKTDVYTYLILYQDIFLNVDKVKKGFVTLLR